MSFYWRGDELLYWQQVTLLSFQARRWQIPALKTRITEGGRIVIPAEYRRALGLHVGDEVMVSLDDGELRILTIEAAIRRAQEIVNRYVPEERSLAEAAHE